MTTSFLEVQQVSKSFGEKGIPAPIKRETTPIKKDIEGLEVEKLRNVLLHS